MPLPKSVQAQVEAADAMLAEMNKPAEAQVPPDAPSDTPAPEPALAEQQPAEQTAPESAPAANTIPPDVWEHKYRTLQGLFNAEVPRLQSQVKELTRQIQEMAQAPKPAEQEKPKPSADPQDVEAFGKDLVEMVQRTAERTFGQVAASVMDRITQLENALKGTSQTVNMTVEQAFFDRLTRLVPDWESINADKAFLTWLGEVDPVYGQPRQAALTAAEQSLNADRAAAVFNAWKSQTATTKPVQPSVDKQVSPRAAASSAPAPQAEKPVITQAQITQFYADVAKGHYRGREAEATKLEQAINQALAEGRVR